MCILTDKHRLVHIACIPFHPIHTRVHFRIHVTISISAIRQAVACSFIMNRTIIQLTGSLITILEVTSVTGFITKTPEKYTRMIPIAQYHTVNAVYKSRNPGWFIANCLIGMILQISFIHTIKPIIIKHSIHFRCIRIMRRTDCVDIIPFHQQDITQHRFCSHCPSIKRMRVVPVHSLEEYPLAINKNLRVPDGYMSETILRRKYHFRISFRIDRILGNSNSIEIRMFGTPQTHISLDTQWNITNNH